MHPDDALASHVADGDLATVSSDYGSMTAVVAVDANVRTGVVSVTHGRQDQTPGRLTSAHAEIDPISTMPHASGLPVTVMLAATR
jgi:anaerobic selenocysteine-containing dehydrogenase